MKENLDQVVKLLNKKYGQGTIAKFSDCPISKVERISSGSFSLDLELGGGFPKSAISEIYGDLSSGKTFIAKNIVKELQKNKKDSIAWIAIENDSFDVEWAKRIGVNTKNIYFAQPDSTEKSIDVVDGLVRSKELDLIIVDSIAAMAPMAEMEASASDWQMGLAARLNNKMVRKLQSALQPGDITKEETYNNCSIILINQVREKIGGYGNPLVVPGGRGIGFACSIRVHLRRGEIYTKKEDGQDKITGHEVKFKVTKNKTYIPYRTGTFDIDLINAKIDNVKSIITYGILYGFIKQGGKGYYLVEEEKIHGKDNLIEYYKQDPKKINELEKQIREIILK